jgi:hypothetical protein
MKPSFADLERRELLEFAERCARDAGTTLESMFSESKRRCDARARTLFFSALHGSNGWTVKRLAEFTGRNEHAIHSAIYQAPRSRVAQ